MRKQLTLFVSEEVLLSYPGPEGTIAATLLDTFEVFKATIPECS